MREIEFRGYSLYQKKFVFGDLVHETKETCIRAKQTIEVQGSGDAKNSIITYVVKPETIGQYTGLNDKNGTKIFEGDQLYVCNGYSSTVKFIDGMFVSVYEHSEDGEVIPLLDVIGKNTIVIGNIHDNP